jgi:hypothetical protein
VWSDALAKTLTAANRSSATALGGVDDNESTEVPDVCQSRNPSSAMDGSIDGKSGDGESEGAVRWSAVPQTITLRIQSGDPMIRSSSPWRAAALETAVGEVGLMTCRGLTCKIVPTRPLP